jgi:hypothetical protein
MKKIKDSFTKFYSDTYGMLITVSWILLIVCLIIKLLGGNWFDLNTENSKFIDFCNYVETHQILKMSIACVIYLISGYFILSIILKEKLKPKHILIFYPLMIVKSLLGWYISGITFIFDFVIIIIIPIILTRNWKRIIIANILLISFQLITIYARNLGIIFSGSFNEQNNTIVSLLYQIDYYLMILLYYLYTFKNRKEIKK